MNKLHLTVQWLETFFEVSARIGAELAKDKIPHKIEKLYQSHGRMEMHELAKDLTTEFETIHEDRKWDGEWFDELDKFLNNKLL